MKKRYGSNKEFTIKSEGSGLGRYNMYLTVEGKEGWEVCLSWYPERSEFYDNYKSWELQKEVEAIYLPLIRQVYDDCKSYNTPYSGQQSNIYTKDTTINDYIETADESSFDIFLRTDSSDRQEKLEQLANLIKANNLHIDITVLYVPAELMDMISRDNYNDIINEGQYLMLGGYVKMKEGEGQFRGWKEGKLR